MCDRLEGCGSTGVTVAEAALDTFIPPDPDSLFRGDFSLRAYFPAQDVAALVATIRRALSDFPAVEVALDFAVRKSPRSG